MAPVTQAGLPNALLAGDSLIFTATYAEYPQSEGWTLSYSFRGVGTLETAASEVVAGSGGAWTITIPAARTAPLPAGTYQWFAVQTGSGSYAGRRDTVESGRINVSLDPASALAGDYRAQSEKDLEAVRAALSGRVTDDLSSYMIGGRQVVLIPIRELVALESRLKREVWRLQNPGLPYPRIRMVFSGIT